MSLDLDLRHFAQVLPARALQVLMDSGELSDDIVALYDINHANITSVMLRGGVDCEQALQPVFEKILLEEYVPFNHPNTYEAIEPQVRGDKNPLIDIVRDTVRHVLTHGH